MVEKNRFADGYLPIINCVSVRGLSIRINMKITKILAVLLLIVSMITISCDKQEEPVEKSQSKYLSAVVNPYDYLGQMHNDVLTYTAENSDVMQFDLTEFIELSREYLQDVDADFILPIPVEEEVDQFVLNYTPNPVFSDIITDLYNEDYISTEQRNILFSIDKAMNYFADNGELELYLQKISNIEEYVNGSSLESEDKVVLWGTLAIARYSMQYWSGIGDESHPYYEIWAESKALPTPREIFNKTVDDVSGYANGFFNPISTDPSFGDRIRSAWHRSKTNSRMAAV